ncbi:MAG: YfiR family protein [Rhodospirillaceae bacterium]
MALLSGRYNLRPAAYLGVVAAIIASSLAAAATPDASVEYAVKAAYLYKFGEFVEWPQSAFGSQNSPATLCIVGDDPFGATLDKAVAGQRIANRSIEIKRLKTATAGSGCQVMYVAGKDAESLGKAIGTVRGESVLTITDGAAGVVPPGIINFVITNNRVRFEIDDGAAAANGLTISSKLLALATSVKPKG